MEATPVRILLLSGSLNNPFHTLKLLENLAALLREQGVIAHVWNLNQTPLPILKFAYQGNLQVQDSKAVQLLTQSANQADAFVFGTPVYHNSYSEILKNTLDHLRINQFCYKPVALISHGRERTAVQPCDQLRVVAQSLLATVLPTQVVTSDADFGLYKGTYILINPAIENLLIRMADELLEHSPLMRRLRKIFL
jgi:azobenzene reductase